MLGLAIAILTAGAAIHYRYGYFQWDLSGNAWGTDDAYITYRYARNLASGHGPVFNRSAEPVEGFSAPVQLWIVALALHCGLDDKDALPFSAALGTLCALVALLLFHRRLSSRLDPPRALLGSLLFAGCPLLWLWAVSGMETALVVSLQLGLWLAVEHVVEAPGSSKATIAALVAALLVLARADGFVTCAIGVLYLVLRGKRAAAGIVMVGTCLALAGLLLWRLSTYGHLLPNTYHVKVTGDLLERLAISVRLLGWMLGGMAFFIYLAAPAINATRLVANLVQGRLDALRQLRFDTVFAFGWLLYWLVIGGDIYLERFLLILVPLGIFGLLHLLGPLSPRTTVILAVMMVAVHASVFMTTGKFRYSSSTKYDRWVLLGRFLKENHPRAVVAVDAAGKIPFFSGLPAIDMLGLNDPGIARRGTRTSTRFFPGHTLHDADYVLSRRPDLITAWVCGGCDSGRCDERNLCFGLHRERYRAAGYHLRYLVNAGKHARDANIVDVSKLERQAVQRLLEDGYRYGVLARR